MIDGTAYGQGWPPQDNREWRQVNETLDRADILWRFIGPLAMVSQNWKWWAGAIALLFFLYGPEVAQAIAILAGRGNERDTTASGGFFLGGDGGRRPAILGHPKSDPIEIHTLAYDPSAGVVMQDRTIFTNEEAVFLEWAARIADAETDATVSGCNGSGSYAYPAGRRAVTLSLADWTGNENCNIGSLEAGRAYVLRASWKDADNRSVSAMSEPFTVGQ